MIYNIYQVFGYVESSNSKNMLNFDPDSSMTRNFCLISFLLFILSSCGPMPRSHTDKMTTKVIFLHHSTGKRILRGNKPKWAYKFFKNNRIAEHFTSFSKKQNIDLTFHTLEYPSRKGYGWNNYPYDYYTIWVKNRDSNYFRGEPNLETLAAKYDVIVLKHCFPVGLLKADSKAPDIDSSEKTLSNYSLQYTALKERMHEFPEKKFIVWTGPALVENQTNSERAYRYRIFYDWLLNEWDETGDNIFLWDLYKLQTEGGLYLQVKYAANTNDSHPNSVFSEKVSALFANRILGVVKGEGDIQKLTGEFD